MRMIGKPAAKQMFKKKSQLKIIETMKIELILSQIFFSLRKCINLIHTLFLKGRGCAVKKIPALNLSCELQMQTAWSLEAHMAEVLGSMWSGCSCH